LNVAWNFDNSQNIWFAHHNTPTPTTDHFVCVTLADWTNDQAIGVLLRATNVATEGKYALVVKPFSSDYRLIWENVAGQTHAIILSNCTAFAPITSPMTICAQSVGTGASTVVKAWKNPTGGNNPSAWGTATCTYSDCTSGGATPGNCADVGTYTGIVVDVSLYGTSTGATFDTYSEGQ